MGYEKRLLGILDSKPIKDLEQGQEHHMELIDILAERCDSLENRLKAIDLKDATPTQRAASLLNPTNLLLVGLFLLVYVLHT
jgi:hypothetical protein